MAGVSLFILVVPASLLFLFMVNLLGAGHVDITPLFVVGYTIAAMSQVGILLPLSAYIVNLVWRRQLDPDDVRTSIIILFTKTAIPLWPRRSRFRL